MKFSFPGRGACLHSLWLAACFTCFATSATSQALPVGNETDSEWRFSFTPYAYVPFSIEGTSVVADTTIDLDLGFDDAIDLLDFAISGRAESVSYTHLTLPTKA